METQTEAGTVWRIWISGYGEFEFVGTEEEAEQARANKARWEGGNGQKWRADLSRESDRLTAQIAGAWDRGEGVSQKLLISRRAARDAEQAALSPRELVKAGEEDV